MIRDIVHHAKSRLHIDCSGIIAIHDVVVIAVIIATMFAKTLYAYGRLTLAQSRLSDEFT